MFSEIENKKNEISTAIEKNTNRVIVLGRNISIIC